MKATNDFSSGGWVKVAERDDLPSGAMICVEPSGDPIAIYHLDDGTFCATDAVCSHQYALLTDGLLEDDMVECPLHAAQFNVRTGKALCEPAEVDLKIYEVRADEAGVFLRLPAS